MKHNTGKLIPDIFVSIRSYRILRKMLDVKRYEYIMPLLFNPYLYLAYNYLFEQTVNFFAIRLVSIYLLM